MHRFVFGLFAFAALASAADSLRVMTFNVRYPSKDDGENIWEKRKDILIGAIRDQRPDVMGTQELFHLQGEYIVERLPEYAWFGLSRRGNKEDEHMGVFYRKDRLRPVTSGNYWLSETPDTPGSIAWNMSLPRMVTWAEFEDLQTRKHFHYVNTHFAHRREDNEARTQSARLIASRLRALPQSTTVVMTGDFNTDAGSEPYRALTEILTDAWTAVPKPAGPAGTFHGFSGKPGSARIDWILFRGGLRPVSIETLTDNEGGRYPSDHFPVIAVFEWK